MGAAEEVVKLEGRLRRKLHGNAPELDAGGCSPNGAVTPESSRCARARPLLQHFSSARGAGGRTPLPGTALRHFSRLRSSMASPVADAGQSQQHPLNSAAGSAFQEAQKWIEVSRRARTQVFRVCLVVLVCQVTLFDGPLRHVLAGEQPDKVAVERSH